MQGVSSDPRADPGDILSRVSPPGTPPVSFVAFYPSYRGSPAMIGWRIKFIATGVYLKTYFSLFMIGLRYEFMEDLR